MRDVVTGIRALRARRGQRLGPFGEDDPAAGKNHRAFGLLDQVDHLAQLFRLGL